MSMATFHPVNAPNAFVNAGITPNMSFAVLQDWSSMVTRTGVTIPRTSTVAKSQSISAMTHVLHEPNKEINYKEKLSKLVCF